MEAGLNRRLAGMEARLMEASSNERLNWKAQMEEGLNGRLPPMKDKKQQQQQ